jgi:predicted AlkP superfamily phosphohydrolase/phosphomutase
MLGSLRSIYRRYIPRGVRERLRLRKRLAATGGAAIPAEPPRPRFSHRKFFAVPHNQNAGAIRFNLVGRERYGIVPPGAEYDALRERLIEDLLAIKNTKNGGALISEIVDVSQHFRGEYRDELPDLLLLWSREAPISAVRSPLIGNVKVGDPSSRTGDHTQNALLLIAGPGVAAKPLPEDTRAEDIAPTLAALLDVSLDNVDGVPLSINC